jgi:multisubunit Na+/H+ antiporter MnhB subunit
MLKNLAIIKLSHDPLISIGGAYFPGWLMCMIVGILVTWITAIVASRFHFSDIFQPHFLMIPGFFAAITLWTWLFYFSAR